MIEIFLIYFFLLWEFYLWFCAWHYFDIRKKKTSHNMSLETTRNNRVSQLKRYVWTMNLSKDNIEQFSERLRQIRFRRRCTWIIFFGYIPSMLIISYLISPFISSENIFIFCVIAYALILMVCSIYSFFSKCPRCNNVFSYKGFSNPWNQRCLHCKLHIKADLGKS